jgi:hypothetical protein
VDGPEVGDDEEIKIERCTQVHVEITGLENEERGNDLTAVVGRRGSIGTR